MSTQHPDNVSIPFFSESTIIKGDDEVREAYYAFSYLGCHEQMWDYEGKDVDVYVVKKLLSRYSGFFEENILGKDVFLTLRIPNPSVERTEAKVMIEVLESIPRSFDYAELFYGSDAIAPVFEVILPMTSSSHEINRVYYYYMNFVIGKADKSFFRGDISISEWIGKFKPERVSVIPLFEDKPYLLNCKKILKEYFEDKLIEVQRVFLAKSDLALNYGAFASDVYLKKSLEELEKLEEECSVEIYPIIGFGSPPFRGGLRVDSVGRVIEKWRNIQTFTIQSAFKYDWSERRVVKAINLINSGRKKREKKIVSQEELEVADKYAESYRRAVTKMADLINFLAAHVPRRRARKLHIGLFGYSRCVNGLQLPRAIPFCCSLYSLGLPPELLGLSGLNEKDADLVFELMEDEIEFALKYFCVDLCKKLDLDEIYSIKLLKDYGFEFERGEYQKVVEELYDAMKNNRINLLQDKMLQAAKMRKFLG